MSTVRLDPQEMVLTPRGLEDFYWPIDREEMLDVRDSLLSSFRGSVQRVDDSTRPYLRMLRTQSVTHGLALYRAYALKHRLSGIDYSINFPQNSTILEPIANGRWPGQSRFSESFENKLSVGRWWAPSISRQIKWATRWNGLKVENFLPLRHQRDTVSITVSSLVEKHARSTGEVVKYRPISDWFSRKPSIGTSSPTVGTEKMDTLIGALSKAFAAGNETLPDFLEEYFRQWIDEMVATAISHSERISTEKKLPGNLWAGTANIWVRILKKSINENGGVVTCHDHGNGAGHLNLLLKTLTDLDGCDRFVTYNKGQSGVLEDENPYESQIIGEPPDISSVPQDGPGTNASSDLPGNQSERAIISEIMYVSPVLPGEFTHLEPLLPEPTLLDWQCRLFSQLQDWGYRVIYKPHPDSFFSSPPGFSRFPGVEMTTDLFETAMGRADAFLYDMPVSSTFPRALMSDKPVTIVDFGLMNTVPKIRALLEKRCSMLNGFFTETNRASVEWDGLRGAIEKSIDKKDQEYVDTYLRGCD